MPGYSALRSATFAAGVRITTSSSASRLARRIVRAGHAPLGVIGVRRDHRCELGPVVERRAVVEDDGGERRGSTFTPAIGHARHLDDAAERVALSASLNTEEADGVRLVQVERDLAASGLSKETELRRRLRRAENNVAARVLPAQALPSVAPSAEAATSVDASLLDLAS